MVATPTEIANFIETYQIRHVSKAAIRLGITQPSLTQSLQKLEEKAGAKLFHRTKQGIIPTEEGDLFYAHARNLLDSWREVGSQISASRTELHGRFRVGCHTAVGAYTLPRFFENLSREAPEIEIDLIHDFSRKITEQVISYEIELGFVVNPVRHLDLVLKKLGEDKISFWKKKGLLQVPRRVFADSNLKQVEMLLAKTSGRDFKNWKFVQTSSLELARELTAEGMGIGVLPGRVAQLAQHKLSIYQKSLPVFQDEIYLVYRKEVLTSNAGRKLIALASNALT